MHLLKTKYFVDKFIIDSVYSKDLLKLFKIDHLHGSLVGSFLQNSLFYHFVK